MMKKTMNFLKAFPLILTGQVRDAMQRRIFWWLVGGWLVITPLRAQQQQPKLVKGPHPVRPTKEMAQQVSDPEARRILEKMSKKFSKFKTYQVRFKLKLDIPETDDDEIKTGTLWVQGQKYRLDLGDQLVISDGKTLWTYLKESNEVQINNDNPENADFRPRDLFKDYGDEYLYQLVAKGTLRDKPVYIIDLTPLDKKKPYFKIRLYVDQKSYQLWRAVIFDKGGTRYVFDVQSFVGDIPMPESLFTFDTTAYPGIQVVDLR